MHAIKNLTCCSSTRGPASSSYQNTNSGHMMRLPTNLAFLESSSMRSAPPPQPQPQTQPQTQRSNTNVQTEDLFQDEMLRILSILESAEDVLNSSGGWEALNHDKDLMSLNDDRQDQKENLFDLMEPTPIGPNASIHSASSSFIPTLPGSQSILNTNTYQMKHPLDFPDEAGGAILPLKLAEVDALSQLQNFQAFIGARGLFQEERQQPKPLTVFSAPLVAANDTTTTHSGSDMAQSLTDSNCRFRQYQSDQWTERFQDMIDFQRKFGHCLVPHHYSINPPLAQWVKRQRYQYKLKNMGRHSTLTSPRQLELEAMGFIWDSHKAAWYERLEALKEFQQENGHCNVPSSFCDRPLAIWVKCQRRQMKIFRRGQKTSMTSNRYRLLEQLGFDWNPRNL